jgi:hypothetical protein
MREIVPRGKQPTKLELEQQRRLPFSSCGQTNPQRVLDGGWDTRLCRDNSESTGHLLLSSPEDTRRAVISLATVSAAASRTQAIGPLSQDSQCLGRFDKNQYNDPSAGSPTETLLRLHLPLNDKV